MHTEDRRIEQVRLDLLFQLDGGVFPIRLTRRGVTLPAVLLSAGLTGNETGRRYRRWQRVR